MLYCLSVLLGVLLLTSTSWAQSPFANVGQLVHDGPATPHQLSLFVPFTGPVPDVVQSTVRYKKHADTQWNEGPRMHRIIPERAESTPNFGARVPNNLPAFAWTLIKLEPATAYDVEVLLWTGSQEAPTQTRTATLTTAALPGPTGPPTTFVHHGMSADDIRTVLNAARPGDIIQFNDGVYELGSRRLQVDAQGTPERPIVLRGQSPNAVLRGAGFIFYLVSAQYVRFENMSLVGAGAFNSQAPNTAFFAWSGAVQRGIVIRDMHMAGVDRCIIGSRFEQAVFYHNTCFGNAAQWDYATTGTNATWNLDGINLPGAGNVAFNNFVRFFGDCLAVSFGGHPDSQNAGIHFYGNEVADCHDDAIEFDYGMRNVNAYMNRFTNVMTCLSYDALYAGPSLYALNTCVNKGRQLFKLTAKNSGYFILNNTFVATDSLHTVNNNTTAEAMVLNFCCGNAQEDYAVLNNVFVYTGTGKLALMESPGNTRLDYGYNLWAPRDGGFAWPGTTRNSLAEFVAAVPATTPYVTTLTKRHEHDVVELEQPFVQSVVLGPTYLSQVQQAFNLALKPGSLGKHSGLVIPGVTDGFSGPAPDRGAVIAGQPVLRYGPSRWR